MTEKVLENAAEIHKRAIKCTSEDQVVHVNVTKACGFSRNIALFVLRKVM
jgi:hypothetical protein